MRLRGDLESAFAYSRRALDTVARAGESTTIIGTAFLTMSRVQHEAGDYDSALVSIEESIRHMERANAGLDLVQARVQLALILLAQGELCSARQIIEDQLREARAVGLRVWEAETHRVLGQVAAAQGDVATAREQLRVAVDMDVKLHADYEAGLSFLELARFEADGGTKATRHAATVALDRAERIFDRVGAKRRLEDVVALRERMEAGPLRSDTRTAYESAGV